MRTKTNLLFAVDCMYFVLQWTSSCVPDDHKNKTDIMLMWTGSEDLLKATTPLVSWMNYPIVVDGEEIMNGVWKKNLHYEDFDSILVYAIVTYPKPSQLPDTIGKTFTMYHQLTGSCDAFNDESDKVTSFAAIEEIKDTTIKGHQLEHYLDSLSGVIHQKGIIVYSDGRVREKMKFEELS